MCCLLQHSFLFSLAFCLWTTLRELIPSGCCCMQLTDWLVSLQMQGTDPKMPWRHGCPPPWAVIPRSWGAVPGLPVLMCWWKPQPCSWPHVQQLQWISGWSNSLLWKAAPRSAVMESKGLLFCKALVINVGCTDKLFFLSCADDGHPHELLHQAPAESVLEAGVWYNVSDHLLQIAISPSSRECCWLWGHCRAYSPQR